MKEKTPGFCFSGFLIMMEIPKDMNGLEKSMTRSRKEVIVSGATARSASCRAGRALVQMRVCVWGIVSECD